MAKKIILDPFPWRGLNPQPVVGVDEVGRGCLAGPVYAAAVILPPHFENLIPGLTDSKKLSAVQRKKIAENIHIHAQVSLGFATVEEIDQINILQASLLAMHRALLGLKLTSPAHVLVDGNQKIKQWTGVQTTVVQGDNRAEPIGAASIVAKVYRDDLMTKLGELYPGYGLEDHKGYATPIHKEAIAKLGPCPTHRRSFAGVKEHLSVCTTEGARI